MSVENRKEYQGLKVRQRVGCLIALATLSLCTPGLIYATDTLVDACQGGEFDFSSLHQEVLCADEDLSIVYYNSNPPHIDHLEVGVNFKGAGISLLRGHEIRTGQQLTWLVFFFPDGTNRLFDLSLGSR